MTTVLQHAIANLDEVPEQTRVEVIRGVTLRRKKKGLTVLSLHYSSIPERDPETDKGKQWYEKERARYSSTAMWRKEQEIDAYATGGEAVFGRVLSEYYSTVVISDPNWFPDPRWDVVASFDHGATNATALLKAYIPRERIDPKTGKQMPPDVYLCGEYYSYRREGWSNNVDQNVPVMRAMPDMDRARWIMADPSIFYETQAQEKGAPTNIYTTYHKNGMFSMRAYGGVRSDVTFVEWMMSDYWRGIANGRKPRLYIVCRNPSDRPQPGLHPYDCPNLLWELKRAKRVEMTARQLLTKNPSENLQDKHNHLRDCLVAGTLITTRAGDVPIEQVESGAEVLTRKGWRRVEDAWLADSRAQTYRVKFSNGSEIIGTAGEKIFIRDRGFVRIDELDIGMTGLCSRVSSDRLKLRSGWAYASTATRPHRATPTVSISKPAASISMCSSGSSRPAKLFRPVITSTMSTEIAGITLHPTWKQKRHWLTLPSTTVVIRTLLRQKLRVSMRTDTKRLIGTRAPRAELGIAKTAGARYAHSATRYAPSAEPHFRTGTRKRGTVSARGTAARSGATATVSMRSSVPVNTASVCSRRANTIGLDFVPELAPVRVSEVQPISGRQAVYDLAVEGEHEFFANGVLVHNCMKYLTGSLRNPTEVPLAEIMEEKLAGLDAMTAPLRARFLMSSMALTGKLGPDGKPRQKKVATVIDLRRSPGVIR